MGKRGKIIRAIKRDPQRFIVEKRGLVPTGKQLKYQRIYVALPADVGELGTVEVIETYSEKVRTHRNLVKAVLNKHGHGVV